MSRSDVRWAVILTVILVLVFAVAGTAIAAKGGNKPPNPGGGGGHTTTATNNLSFPVIAVDQFSITAVTESLTLPYTGTYPGVADAKEYGDDYILNYLEVFKPWYAQKTENKWQASYALRTKGEVTVVDWSDSMEGVFPKANTPFRLEVVLFNRIAALTTDAPGVAATLDPSTTAAWSPMYKYKMGVLEYPSSSNELQGTNGDKTVASDWATVVSGQPKLVVQYLGADGAPDDITWETNKWTSASTTLLVDPVSFAVELNVGGKYIFGASKKGWKPALNGFYRVTFYAPVGSQVDMTGAYTGDAATGYLPSAGDAATGYVDATNNLAYIDLEVGGTSEPGGDE